jgi:hypothetical protein
MIDAESEIFTKVSTKVREKYPKIFMTGEYVSQPPSFPCISLIEIDNSTFQRTQSNEGRENHVAVSYELNVFSNKEKGKKAECKAIASFVDELMMKMNFTRMMLEPVQNPNSNSIYRMLGRYRAVVGRDHTIYRR